ncbi:DUF969 domain-containing protein [Dokdonella sp. MW10]|uniref:DUF969 domain-containing protein n=1 Tax=Dokdonella sp. MW10 TaxID=2992926 RepID=UPI003F8005BE
MAEPISYWPLLGVGVVVAGFALRRNPVLVVVTAGVVSGLASGKPIPELLALLGGAFIENRLLLLLLLTFPVIGLLERHGLRERARTWIGGFRGLTLARFLTTYLGLRQLLGMVGLTQVAGHVQTVRPLVAPMSEAAAARSLAGDTDEAPSLRDDEKHDVRAMAAATDNVGLFFGEDVFIAFGAVLLIQGFYARNGIELEPLSIALWALPTAIFAFAIHATRLWLMQRRMRRARAATEVTRAEG